MMLKLKLQYFGHLMQRVDSLEKTLMLGRIWGRRRRGRQRMRWLDGITDSLDVESEWNPAVSDRQGGLACCDSWGRKELDTTERLNWTELNWSTCVNQKWHGPCYKFLWCFLRACRKNQSDCKYDPPVSDKIRMSFSIFHLRYRARIKNHRKSWSKQVSESMYWNIAEWNQKLILRSWILLF